MNYMFISEEVSCIKGGLRKVTEKYFINDGNPINRF